MDAAYIKNGTITNAKIGDLAVDNAKISDLSVGKLTAGKLSVGEWIASSNYKAGTAGWAINSDGTAELSNAVVRGTVYATDGEFGGVLTADAVNAVNTINLAGQAVTIPTAAYTDSESYYSPPNYNSSAIVELQSVAFSSSGAPVFLIFTCNLLYYGGNILPHVLQCAIQIQASVNNNAWATVYSGVTRSASDRTGAFENIAISVVHTPGKANVSYRAVANIIGAVSGLSLSFYQKSLFALEVKR
jgi:hypothetical protein